MKTENELRKRLNEIFNEIKTRKLAWRFNYSVGLPNGSCFGSSLEDDRLLKKILHMDAKMSNPYFQGTQGTQKMTEKLHDGKKTAVQQDNQHPVGSCVYLHDVISLFKNRRQTKTRVNQRRHIIEHLNKLRRVEVK